MSTPVRILDLLRRRLARGILGHLPLESQTYPLSSLSEEHLHEIRSLFPMPKFFIFGYPRSGTTLLMRLISLHPQVHCNREAHFFTRAEDAVSIFADREIRQWLERKSNRWTTGQGLEIALVRLVADFLMEREARQLGKNIVGDKTPNANAGEAVRRMSAVYPEARLIYIVRDGRDAALSHRFQHFIDHPHLMSHADRRIRRDFSRNSRPYFNRQRSIFTTQALVKEARAWSANVTDTHASGIQLLAERYLSLRYEDLLASPIEHLGSVWLFLGADPNFADMERLVQEKMNDNPGAEAHLAKDSELASHLKRGREGNWRELFTPRDCQIFKDLAGQTLIDWKYEKDLNW